MQVYSPLRYKANPFSGPISHPQQILTTATVDLLSHVRQLLFNNLACFQILSIARDVIPGALDSHEQRALSFTLRT